MHHPFLNSSRHLCSRPLLPASIASPSAPLCPGKPQPHTLQKLNPKPRSFVPGSAWLSSGIPSLSSSNTFIITYPSAAVGKLTPLSPDFSCDKQIDTLGSHLNHELPGFSSRSATVQLGAVGLIISSLCVPRFVCMEKEDFELRNNSPGREFLIFQPLCYFFL